MYSFPCSTFFPLCFVYFQLLDSDLWFHMHPVLRLILGRNFASFWWLMIEIWDLIGFNFSYFYRVFRKELLIVEIRTFTSLGFDSLLRCILGIYWWRFPQFISLSLHYQNWFVINELLELINEFVVNVELGCW